MTVPALPMYELYVCQSVLLTDSYDDDDDDD